MRIQLLLALLAVSECISSPVVGFTGQSITLPCVYDIKYHGVRPICWNRGEIPLQACDNQVVATGEYKAKEDTSGSRFQLLGRLDEGDVSMTILNLTEDDAGRYGCRVDISGWFNDAKHHIDLEVIGAPQTTTRTEGTTESTTQQPSWTPDHMTTDVSASFDDGSSDNFTKDGGELTVVLVSVFFGLVALTTAGGAVVMVRRWRHVNKTPQVNTSVQFTSTSSTLQLESRASTLDNIYQVDECVDYEYCP